MKIENLQDLVIDPGSSSGEIRVTLEHYVPQTAIESMREQLLQHYAHVPNFERRLVIENGTRPLMRVMPSAKKADGDDD